MATADAEGRVDTAIYAKPHFLEPETVSFITGDRLTHANLRSNPHANYMFLECDHGYKGVRLFLRLIKESTDQEQINALSRRPPVSKKDGQLKERFLLTFTVDKALEVIGGKEVDVE